jgi:glycosyltransferase involved in cell wall biosynthesis
VKVLVFSHSCVVDVNQQVYVALRQVENTDVLLVVPANWKNEYTGAAMTPTILPGVDFEVHAAPVALPGKVPLHFYMRLPMAAIRKFRPDVILASQEPYSMVMAQAMRLASNLNVPCAFQTNQNIVKNYPPPFGWIEKKAFRTAGYALAYSEEARQVMRQKGRTGPSAVVPYATDVSLFVRQETTIRRRELGLGDAVVVGYMGRLVPEKGLDTLISAMKHLQTVPNLPDVRALIVGAGTEAENLKRQIAEAGLTDRFVFTGVVPHSEAATYMSCMDIFVLPSRTTPTWKEQFGRVIIEALACGVPVVGADSGQIPLLIQETGGGIVFPEGDETALASALESLIRDPEARECLARRGAATVQERFTCEAVARQMHGLFREMLAPSGAGTK